MNSAGRRQRLMGLPTACLRYFNVYGPGQDPNSQYATVIPRFIGRILEGEPPIISGDGEQTRDFTFIEDVVEANILAVQNNVDGVFNTSTGQRITINKLATTIAKLIGKNLEPIYQEPRAGDIKHSLTDTSRAKGIGYEPRYTLKAGLKETINFFENRRFALSKD